MKRLAAALILTGALCLGGAEAAPNLRAAAADTPALDPIQTLADARRSVVVVTRARMGRLKSDVAAPALSRDAFSTALSRTFGFEDGLAAGHSTPVPLPPVGALAGGFVAAIDAYDGRCGFAVAGLDFSGKTGADGLDATAAVIFCAADAAALAELATPARIAAKVARIPPE